MNQTLKKAVLFVWERKEAFIWITALMFLAFSHPGPAHYTLCPLKNLGFHFCPGCGLGTSITYFFHMDLKASIEAHPLGIPAVMLLITRSVQVFRHAKKTYIHS